MAFYKTYKQVKAIGRLVLATLVFGALLVSCDSWIYDKTEDCPQGVYLKYYAQSTCGDSLASFYDEFGKSSSLTIFAFDQNNKLASWKQVNDVDLTQDYHYLYNIENGAYYFYTWVNATKANMALGDFKVGTTTPTDMAFAMRRVGDGTLVNIDTTTHVWAGRSDSVVFLPAPQQVHTEWYDTVANRLVDQTKKVRITIEGLEPDSVRGIQVYLEMANYTKELDATPIYENERQRLNYNHRYLPGQRIDIDSTARKDDYMVLNDSTVSFDFKTLTLYPNTTDRLVIKTGKGTVLWNESLVGTILLRNSLTKVSLDCDYNFHVRFRVRAYKYLSVDVMIGAWLVHSYETSLRLY